MVEMKWTVLLTLGTIWGASYLFIKIGGAEIPPVTFVTVRLSVATIAVGLILLARRETYPRWRPQVWLPLLVMGITNGVVPYVLITWGETQIPSGLAGILVGTMPIFTVLLAHWVTNDEKLNAYKIVGIATGFIGVVVLFLPDLRQGITLSLIGSLAVVVAAISYAFAGVYAHRYIRNVSHLAAEFGQLTTGAIILLPASLLHDQPWRLTPSLPAAGSLLTLALLGTAFAYLLYYWLIEHAGPTSTSLVTYISPVSAIFLGAVILHEQFDWTAFAGFASIVAGVALVSRSSPQTAQPPVGVEAE